MNIQRFSGANSREAIQKVKAALGDNALILGNRRTDFGIEIIAAPDGDAPPPRPAAVESAMQQVLPELSPPAAPARPTCSADSAEPAPSVRMPDFGERLMAEFRDVKTLLTTSTARMQGQDSNSGRLRRLLLGACFSEELASELSLDLPDALQHEPWGSEVLRDWLLRQLMLRLPEPAAGEAMMDAGGIFALVGPTGSGKTTTTAKIAAQYVMRCGGDSLALVSTDYYRIGAHEQLREYANLLNVPFHAVEPGQPLGPVLESLADKRLVLIDTVGLSQRDERVMRQFAELQSACDALSFVLLLSGSSHQQTLEEVVRSYRRSAASAGGSIDYCILTKLDEACSPALLLDKVICHTLRPIFTTAGQRVPEDINMPELPRLLTPVVDGLLKDADAPLGDAAARPADWTRHLLSRGRQISVALRLLRESVPCAARLESLWDISLLDPNWQQARVAELAVRPFALYRARPSLLWSVPEPEGDDDWRCPHLLLDEDLQPTAGTVLQTIRQSREFEGIERQLGCRTHLFSTLPDARTLAWLRDQQRHWVAQLPKRATVTVAGEVLPVARVAELGTVAGTYPTLCRSQEAIIELSRLPCSFEVDDGEGAQAFAAVAWAATVRCCATDAVLLRRYWLTHGEQGVEQLLTAHLSVEGYHALARHALAALQDMPGFQACADLRLLVASALAATALRIELATDTATVELRTQLLAILGGKRACSGKALVDALSYLFIARELLVPERTN